jgi:hypothetical protein
MPTVRACACIFRAMRFSWPYLGGGPGAVSGRGGVAAGAPSPAALSTALHAAVGGLALLRHVIMR